MKEVGTSRPSRTSPCEVKDDDHHLPVLRPGAEGDELGRGLNLVAMLARRWGANRTSDGKVVWFELTLPGLPG